MQEVPHLLASCQLWQEEEDSSLVQKTHLEISWGPNKVPVQKSSLLLLGRTNL